MQFTGKFSSTLYRDNFDAESFRDTAEVISYMQYLKRKTINKNGQ